MPNEISHTDNYLQYATINPWVHVLLYAFVRESSRMIHERDMNYEYLTAFYR